MPPRTIENGFDLGEAIKSRRIELNLTIEGAASKAGIGTKTWSRYESGESIRSDKVSGLCRALRWKSLPHVGSINSKLKADFEKEKKSEVWSPYLANHFGKYAAMSFVIGSDILLDEINEDLEALSEMPRSSHIGELTTSVVSSIMPQQFLTRYDYEFMWVLRQALIRYRKIAPHTNKMVAHSVLDELVLYLIMEESRFLMEEIQLNYESDDDKDEFFHWDEWVHDICDDMDLVTFLYSDLFLLSPEDAYHFENWQKQQFFVPEEN